MAGWSHHEVIDNNLKPFRFKELMTVFPKYASQNGYYLIENYTDDCTLYFCWWFNCLHFSLPMKYEYYSALVFLYTVGVPLKKKILHLSPHYWYVEIGQTKNWSKMLELSFSKTIFNRYSDNVVNLFGRIVKIWLRQP